MPERQTLREAVDSHPRVAEKDGKTGRRCGLELAGLGDNDGGRRTLSNRGNARGAAEARTRWEDAGLLQTACQAKVCAAVTATQAACSVAAAVCTGIKVERGSSKL